MRKRQVSFIRSALWHGLRWQVAVLCTALLSAGSVVPAHAQLANSEPVMVAAAAAKTTKETEEALGLTRSQRVWVQKGLNALNFDVGTADGLFGARTRAGVARWQSARGDAPTGYLDSEAAEMLIEVGKGVSPTKPQADGAQTSVTEQSTSEDVREADEATRPSESPSVVRVEEAIDTLNEALSIARRIGEDWERAYALGYIAQVQVDAGDTEGSVRTVSEALSIARRISGGWKRAWPLSGIAPAQAKAGDIQGAAATIAEIQSTARSIGEDWKRDVAHHYIVQAQAAIGDTKSARSTARTIGDDMQRAHALGDIAQVEVEAGDTQGAIRTISEAVSIARRIGEDWKRSSAFGAIAEAQMQAGDTVNATESISEARSTARRIGEDWKRDAALMSIAPAQAAIGDIPGALSTAQTITGSVTAEC